MFVSIHENEITYFYRASLNYISEGWNENIGHYACQYLSIFINHMCVFLGMILCVTYLLSFLVVKYMLCFQYLVLIYLGFLSVAREQNSREFALRKSTFTWQYVQMETKNIKTIKLGDKGFLLSWTGRKRYMFAFASTTQESTSTWNKNPVKKKRKRWDL